MGGSGILWLNQPTVYPIQPPNQLQANYPPFPRALPLPRHYGMFELLFGIRSSYGFEPAVPLRGIPLDASDLVVADFLEFEDNLDPTWITCTELHDIDWDEEVTSIQVHTHGAWEFHSHTKIRGNVEWESEGYGKPYEEDGVNYRVVKAKRGVFKAREWQIVFGWMNDLAELFGPDNVRLVVWFDR
jgi:hypothetical protein